MILELGGYRALRAVLHIVDGKLDLSLLSDQRVLKERYAAQEDRVAGALKMRERGETVLSPAEGRKEGANERQRCTSMISV